MNRKFPLLLAVVTTLLFASSGLTTGHAATRENERLRSGKITKNEAQHLVLQKFPGSKIQRCELTGPKAHSVIVVHLMKPGAKNATEVKVDGRTGAISQ